MRISGITDDARVAAASAADYASSLVLPTIRLGVTGLSRSGKTVFITALVHNLLHGGRMPLFRPLAAGRIRRVYLAPQPDDAVPRFAYEERLAALTGADQHWPESTNSISELRLIVEYEPAGFLARLARRDRIAIDIVDYPGEWLLDLALIGKDFRQWSAEAVAMSRKQPRLAFAGDWHHCLAGLDARAPADEQAAIEAAKRFAAYLRACRSAPIALSTIPPGRLVMPGDLEGSPALTFAPLDLPPEDSAPRRSLWALMERRYDAYRDIVVRPFFRDHFARLDRQIVLVDMLAALNAGPAAIADLEHALSEILTAFRPGRRSFLAALLRPRIDRVLFAATKADHLHQTSHDRLQAILGLLTERAEQRASGAGAEVASLALASVRATREATVSQAGEDIPCIVGVPQAGEEVAGAVFDGEREAVVFPGELPASPEEALRLGYAGPEHFGFVRFRPPKPVPGPAGQPVLPHIRLDRALDFLLADRFA